MSESYEKLAESAMEELLKSAATLPGDIVVVGCSTSEIAGQAIGKGSVPAIGEEIVAGLLPPIRRRGLYLAAQCCEHLNRSLVVEAAALRAHHLTRVNALPRPGAGGSFATAAWQACEAPALAQSVFAAAGLDIGATLIGMHLRPVAVPVRLSVARIGEAGLTAARSRPPFIGGARAHYDDTLL